MGDAAHAMLPYHAQGAVQSLEDAWVLARTLELRGDSPPAALKHYESLRYDRANLLVQQSRSAEGWYHVDTPESDRVAQRAVPHYQREAGGWVLAPATLAIQL